MENVRQKEMQVANGKGRQIQGKDDINQKSKAKFIVWIEQA